MHCSYFSDRIYVEETPEQCCLGHYNLQKAKKVSDGTGTQVKAQMINKCKVKMAQKKIYNERDPP